MSEDRVYLVHIHEMIDNIEELTAAGREDFLAAKHHRAAALYYLQTMSESTQRLSDGVKGQHPEIDWAAISGFRNRLVHGYLGVNFDIVWKVIETNLADLKRAVEAALKELDEKTDE